MPHVVNNDGPATLIAAADLKPYRFIGHDGDYASEDGAAAGVSQMETGQGNHVAVSYTGMTLIEMKTAINPGERIAVSGDDGKGKKAADLSVEIPSDSTPVTSDAAQPDLTIAGGVLPQKVYYEAWDAAQNDGDIVRAVRIG